ncbi:MAG: reverse gyrase [Desulfurococcaceae archaeon]
MNPIYANMCPSCGGEVDAISMASHGVCRKCLTKEIGGYSLSNYMDHLYKEMDEVEELFSNAVGGNKLWNIQRIWLKKLLKGDNISIIAPTGVGKTTLLIAYALHVATKRNWKVLFLTPTVSLGRQVHDKFIEAAKRIGLNSKILFYNSNASKVERSELLAKIIGGDYNILVLTNSLVSRRPELLKEKFFNLIVVDDVDAVLNKSKNIIRLLNALGYTDDVIDLTKRLIELRTKIYLNRRSREAPDHLLEEELKEYIDLETNIRKLKDKEIRGQIVVASATGRLRGPYAAVMRELLELDVPGTATYGRDVTDSYTVAINEDLLSTLVNVIKGMGGGFIVYISPHHPVRGLINVDELVNVIKAFTGLRVAKATPGNVHKLVNGLLDGVIGSASYYGISVRGIDAPKTVKYVVFIGTPCFKIELSKALTNIRTLHRLLIYLNERGYGAGGHITTLSNATRTLTLGELKLLNLVLRGVVERSKVTNDRVLKALDCIEKEAKWVEETLTEILKKEGKVLVGTLLIYRSGERSFVVVPDALTYIQATGRTSRLLNGAMTHGISVLIELEEFKELVKALSKRLEYIGIPPLKHLNELDLVQELKKADASRSGVNRGEMRVRSVLLVVESPTKAKTIAKFYGEPSRRRIGGLFVYEVPAIIDDELIYLSIFATRGHIYDLTTDPLRGAYGIEYEYLTNTYMPIYETIKRCRLCGAQFTSGSSCPKCGSKAIRDSIVVVNVLRKLGSEVDEVLISTDPDAEGEKIAYDVYMALRAVNKNVHRIEFHEVTRNALEGALKNKRSIDLNLVQAQIFRRVLDRLIGFKTSLELQSKYLKKWLGIGRVQAPALKWIIDSYSSWTRGKCYSIDLLLGKEPELTASICIKDGGEAKLVVEKLLERRSIEVLVEGIVDKKIHPKPPYTTDELISDASTLGISAPTTMRIAQELFEGGLITYHRTDSIHVSNVGISIAKNYLESRGLRRFFTPRHWGAQGVHEAIRPVYPFDSSEVEKAVIEGLLFLPTYFTAIHKKVYDIIFKRFIASQMSEAVVRFIKLSIPIHGRLIHLEVPVEVVVEGFNVVEPIRTYSWLTEEVSSGGLTLKNVKLRRSSLSKLLDHGSLVKLMKANGIGRPSTYAPTIVQIRKHGYVIESKYKKYLIPTKAGLEVLDYIGSSYPELVTVEATRYMEELVDSIASGVKDFSEALELAINRVRLQGLEFTDAGFREAQAIGS